MAVQERYSPRLARARCDESPSLLLRRGIAEFNQGRYFDAHETWEEEWQVEKGPQRDLLRGLIHVAAGYHHLTVRRNFRGTFIKLGSGARLLDRFGRQCQGIDLEGVRRSARLNRDRAFLLGRDRLAEFEGSLVPVIRLAE
jgi:predicted metal-dependent hydrolase